ncbi:MAG TPA: NAD-dependent epimerase/dehydratase family protein [Thermoanaerobaculia bacterium]|nr:NAD-dependent epimerase/dehydratase family protein [Thermoanaerobaculia bacterium]
MIAVVGADGTVGSALAAALGAGRVVYRDPRPGETSIGAADELLRSATVVVNAAGFRVRPGLASADYRESHAGAVARLIPRLAPGTMLVQISSASVLGKDPARALGADPAGRPETFGCPAYALAKREAEEVARAAAAAHGLKIVVVRPAVLYGPEPDGMIGTLLTLGRKGLLLRLVPAGHRHHLCSFPLLVEAIERIARAGEPIEPPLVVADPFVVTSAEIAAAIREVHRPRVAIPFPAGLGGAVLRLFPRPTSPQLDLRTWGEILGILALDTVYEPHETFRRLGIDPSRFSRERTWERLIRGMEAAS